MIKIIIIMMCDVQLVYICMCVLVTFVDISGLQHKGTISIKPVFEKIAKIQRSNVPLCGHTTFVLLTLHVL